MKKTLQSKNIITFYVRDKYKTLWQKFVETVNKDPFFLQQKYRKHDVTSIAILNLANTYLQSKGIKITPTEDEKSD